ncbi:DNA polymerase III subunit gamma and tau [Gleimia europaea]|uniref:DNA-directed DNA polymerase n=2 Tax=Actinomycetaceae TaxID=2049 RepID=A0A9W5RF34_9ACTO|nr:DNA polymerase III subunit gamma and tau [Gleimia europaea]EPD31202.1 DNA polymerase III, subunit gamma and tau [Gleimia europaea ACS-120-V-Col10b]
MTIALYRRYRPDTFDDVIGQDHVTEPLKAALRSNRITHAYLFSGPRGCGKTTSARILARCLNCAEGPTDTPCGKCESCVELASGGTGSLDVVEIDAASHNGVDDARELRERASFAPVRDRYKVFILDEAHMVTTQGFNALLKLVEEPPEHVKFIFATTEPERVIGTIRSRTHHYPFRLVPGDVLLPYLANLCESEGIEVGEGVLPLVIRAGGGSVRDSLSVLDQLMAGSIDSKIPYDLAVALLGYTDINLLDTAVEQLAKRDGAGLFATIEQMVESGHDPRRFVEDFLQRLRDLLIIAVAGEQAKDILGQLPADQRERMFAQAKQWGAPALSMAADLTDEALRSMVGATSPRLQLELMIGRILVELSGARVRPSSGEAAPASHSAAPTFGGSSSFNEPAQDGPQILGEDGKPLTGAALAREQLRRSRAQDQANKPAQAAPGTSAPAHQQAPKQQAPQRAGGAQAQAPQQTSAPQGQAPQRPEPAQTPAPAPTAQSAPVPESKPESQPEPKAEAAPADQKQVASSPAPGNVTANLHGKWDQFVEAVRVIMPSSAFLIGEHAKLISEDSATVILGFANQGLANVFLNRHQDTALKAIQVITGVSKTIQVQVGGQPAPAAPTQPPHGNQEPANANGSQSRKQANSHQSFNRANNGREHAANRATPNESASDNDEGAAWPTVRAVPNAQSGTPENQAATASSQASQVRQMPNNAQRENATSQPGSRDFGQSNTQPHSIAGRQDAPAEQARSSAAESGQSVHPHISTVARPHVLAEQSQDTAGPQRTSDPQAVPEPSQETAPTSQVEESDYDFDTGGANMDDADAENSNLVGLPLVERMFGATIIEDTSEGNK